MRLLFVDMDWLVEQSHQMIVVVTVDVDFEVAGREENVVSKPSFREETDYSIVFGFVQMLESIPKVKTAIWSVVGMGVVDQACQLGAFEEQAKLGFAKDDVEGEVEEDSTVNSYRADTLADIGDAGQGSEVSSDVLGEMDILRSWTMLE
jgi:hypothetical protein